MLTVAVVVLTVSLAIVVAARTLWLACRWGALWGAALGVWLLAPALVDADRVAISGALDWFTLSAILATMFAVVAAVLMLVAAAPIALWIHELKQGDGRRSIAFALAVPVVLVPAYVACSAVLEVALLPSTRLGASLSTGTAVGLLLCHLSCSALLLWMSRWSMRPHPGGRDPAVHLAVVLAGACALGAVALPFRVSPVQRSSAPATDVTLAARDSNRAPQAPLLVVGIDSGNWDTIEPLVSQGRLPVFERLLRDGVRGTVRAEWPPYWSAPAWSSILTGFDRDELGLHEDLVVALPGLRPFEVRLRMDIRLNPVNLLRTMLSHLGVVEVAQHSRDALVRSPIWEVLARHGVRVAVLRFPFTYPASGPAAYVVSNRIDTEGWEALGVRRGRTDRVVYPSSIAPDIAEIFSPSNRPVNDLQLRIDPLPEWPNPKDARTDLRPILQSVVRTDSATIAAAHRILAQEPGVSALMLYIGGFDVVCHAFWQYRFPETYVTDPPAADDVERLGGVIDRYLEYLDAELGRLIAAFPQKPNVLVVSDHGHVAAHESAYRPAVWRAWHGPEGIFIASGPDIESVESTAAVSYADVVPTILSLQGFQIPHELRGRVVLPPLSSQTSE